jgi:hypothetical protein
MDVSVDSGHITGKSEVILSWRSGARHSARFSINAFPPSFGRVRPACRVIGDFKERNRPAPTLAYATCKSLIELPTIRFADGTCV